jgi:DNA modification methylase
LIRYLARLILPPKRGTPRRILVPFSGSGSEMIGCLQAGWDEVVGIEREAEYIEIAKARITRGGVYSGLADRSMRRKRERERTGRP